MWYQTSDSYEEFHKFPQVAATDSGLHAVIPEDLHNDIMAYSQIFDSYIISYTPIFLFN